MLHIIAFLFFMISQFSTIAAVTGGSSGIGLAISKELARNGISIVIVNDIHESEGLAACEVIRNEFGVGAEYIMADVSKEKDVGSLFNHIKNKYGRIDILVNDAGITDDALLENMDLVKWERVLAVNLTGTYLCTKHATALMRNGKGGRILNLASVSAENGNVGQANYAAAKGGIISFTRTAAKESARYNILINAIAPGFIRTRMTESIKPEIMQKIITQIPMRRFGEPEEVARLARFLVSHENTYITGQTFNINGGMYF